MPGKTSTSILVSAGLEERPPGVTEAIWLKIANPAPLLGNHSPPGIRPDGNKTQRGLAPPPQHYVILPY